MPSFGAGVKSIQRGVKTCYATTEEQDITTVNTSKAFVLTTIYCTGAQDASQYNIRATLNSTYIKFVKGQAINVYLAWQVVEYN